MSRAIEQVQPIIITAPTARNGVTLLQRLLNSSGEIIVYGENRHFCEALAGLVHGAQWIHLTSHNSVEEARERFLGETTEFWSSSLWPDTKMYLKQTIEAFRSFVLFYQVSSERYGFKRWGIKHPFSDVTAFDRFFRLLTTGKFIYIYRNLFDVARSAKACKFVATPDDFQKLAYTWAGSVKTVLKIRSDNLMVVKYEELVEDPRPWVSRIESLTGITDIDPDVMNKKYNTFQGDTKAGYSPTEYIPPEPLTEAETSILCEHAADVLASLDYHEQPAPDAAAVPA